MKNSTVMRCSVQLTENQLDLYGMTNFEVASFN